MLELICQQRYRVGGAPVDLSPYRNHGTAIDAPAAAGPGHDVIAFPNPGSRVAIGPGKSSAWTPLIALRIEVIARVDTNAARELTLAAGDGAFEFMITEHALTARVGGQLIRSADADSPDGRMHEVRSNRWTKLVLEHDGYARMRLLIDDRLVAEKTISGGVPSVGAGGVAVGNLPGGGRPLLGEVDEISIWRIDPKTMRREFLGRPLTEKEARCWLKAIEAARDWARANPAKAQALVEAAMTDNRAAIRSLFLLPAAAQERLRRDINALTALWLEGKIDSPAMSHAMHRWFADLHGHGIKPNGGAAEIEGLLAGVALRGLQIDCDPALGAYLKHMHKALDAIPGKGR